MTSFPSLFTPVVLEEPSADSPGLILKHRIISGSVTRNRAVAAPDYLSNQGNTAANDIMKEYYVMRARGGASLLLTEGILISRQGTQWENAPGLWTDEHVKSWKAIVDAVHAEGVPIFGQLWHVGRVAHPGMQEQIRSGTPVYGPSAIAARGGKFHLPGRPGYVTPTEIQDPEEFIELFRLAAVRMKEAGFDGIELQGSGGYLGQQFLDNTSNLRTDKWGGSVENRCRFILDTIRALLTIWPSKRVGLKLMTGGGMNDSGMSVEDTYETYNYLLAEVEKLGLGYVQLIRATDSYHDYHDSHDRATKYDMVGHFASQLKNVKLFVSGAVTPEEAVTWVENGTIDAVIMALRWVNNPDLANRLQLGLPLDTVPFPWDNLYSWSKDPAEGYIDVMPVGGLAILPDSLRLITQNVKETASNLAPR